LGNFNKTAFGPFFESDRQYVTIEPVLDVFMKSPIFFVSVLILGCLVYARPSFAAVVDAPLGANHVRVAEISIWQPNFQERQRFQTFDASRLSGGNLVSGDVTGDGKPEIIISSGTGVSPLVRIYDTNGKLIKSFLAYAQSFHGGVRVAVADLDGDGKAEIITAPGPGMEPLIRKFHGDGTFEIPNGSLAYAKNFQGGVHIVAADLDGDGKAEIITTPGPGGGPHVRIFNGQFENQNKDFFAFANDMRDGIMPAVLRTPEGPVIAIAIESWSEPIVKIFQRQGNGYVPKNEFLAFDRNWRSGVSIAAVDLNADGFDEIAAHGNGGSTAELRFLDRSGAVLGKYLVQDPNYRGGLSVAQIDADGDGRMEIATVANAPVVSGPLYEEKSVYVNISQQRLYAYEHGRLVNTFLVSTGISKYPTPVVTTTVQNKTPVKRYTWNYGPGNPDNYDLPNVQWNMNIYGYIYIHGTYWHHNFGHPMSHGCVNLRTSDADWIYHWADIGTPVRTFYHPPAQNEQPEGTTLARQ